MLLVALLLNMKLELMKNLTMLYKQHAFIQEAHLPKAVPFMWPEIQHLDVKLVPLLNSQAYAPFMKITQFKMLKLMAAMNF